MAINQTTLLYNSDQSFGIRSVTEPRMKFQYTIAIILNHDWGNVRTALSRAGINARNPNIDERDFTFRAQSIELPSHSYDVQTLNQYNRKKGTYGNGDGKDASHKGGKIVGFEKESTNRGRREKSRLKKEDIREFKGTQAIHVYLGGIIDAIRKAGIKAKTAKQMKHGFSKSRDKIGFFIEVEQRTFGKKEMYTLQVEIDRDGNLWYLSGHRDMKLGKWADTSKIVRMWKALNKARGFGQDAIFKKR